VDAQGLVATTSEAPAKGHFDTFETVFFQAGEEGGNLPGAFEHLDDLGARRQGPLLSRASLLGLTLASTCVAMLACAALWRSNAPLPALPTAAAPAIKLAPVAATVSQPSAAPPPTESAKVAATESPPSALPVPTAAAPAALPTEEAVPAVAAQPSAAPAAAVAEEEPKADSVTAAAAAPQAAAPPPTSDARERCKQSIREKRNKDIVAFCPAAFAEDAGDADVAVALAKVELDRGRFSQAYAWSKKAIAINPDSADAYVFAGGAEQSKGHGKAAKEAYLHYLRLAPSGRYAAELRAIVGSL